MGCREGLGVKELLRLVGAQEGPGGEMRAFLGVGTSSFGDWPKKIQVNPTVVKDGKIKGGSGIFSSTSNQF